jgi:hypothetical protein
MATITNSIHRATLSLELPAKVADFIAYVIGIGHAMTNNPAFPAPVPALSVLSAAVSDLQAVADATPENGATGLPRQGARPRPDAGRRSRQVPEIRKAAAACLPPRPVGASGFEPPTP